MSNQLSSDNSPEVVSTPLVIWRFSLGRNGTTDISDEQKKELRDEHLVGLYGDLKENDNRNRVNKFLQIRQGNYFYLCYGNSIQLFGRFTTNEYTKGDGGWWERSYEELLEAKSNKPFEGPVAGKASRGWSPNNPGATCFRVPDNELSLFEEYILKPYFDITLSQIPKIAELKMASVDAIKYKEDIATWLKSAYNIILRGAPGTGKTYLARQIAADIVSKGTCAKYEDLSPEQQEQIEFVQFHPSYDYTDFVEGLRPDKKDGSLGFELKDGVFVDFVKRAIKHDLSFEKLTGENLRTILNELIENKTEMSTTKNKFRVTKIDDDGRIYPATIDESGNIAELDEYPLLKIDRLSKCLPFFDKIHSAEDIFGLLGELRQLDEDEYVLSILKYIKDYTERKYVFIIDEINRGEISKIFGELFFSIDPGYRGKKEWAVKTQYANLHKPGEEDFYIPDNVYIIGTMNDIDRSVDSFDFAMRRRFRFIEITAEDAASKTNILNDLGDKKEEAIRRMKALNNAISNTDGLNANYHIGPAYFLRLNGLDYNYDALWTDFLYPLLQEYVRGMSGEEDKLKAFKDAYNLTESQHTSTASGETGNSDEQLDQ